MIGDRILYPCPGCAIEVQAGEGIRTPRRQPTHGQRNLYHVAQLLCHSINCCSVLLSTQPRCECLRALKNVSDWQVRLHNASECIRVVSFAKAAPTFVRHCLAHTSHLTLEPRYPPNPTQLRILFFPPQQVDNFEPTSTLAAMAKEPQYLLPEPEKEIARLTEQDAVITHLMDGKRILAPIDLARPNLRILDSGTADGLFLRGIQPLLTEPFTLLGYDVMQSFFPSTVPPHTTFALHDIAEPWPAELQGTCDLVYQRFTIPGGTKKATPQEIVHNLCQLVKPGGWIQLVEMDVTGTVYGPAMRDAWAATGAFLTAAGAGTDYAKNMAGWLREEGFENVRDEHVDLDLGARVQDPEWATRSAKILVESFTGVVGACKSELNPLLQCSRIFFCFTDVSFPP